MKYYQDITISRLSDVAPHHILTALYENLHQALSSFENRKAQIGLSFPEYYYNSKADSGSLGDTVRVFAKTACELESLNLKDVLADIGDYVTIGEIDEVGGKATHYEAFIRYHRIVGNTEKKKAIRLQNHLIKKFGQQWFDENFGSLDAIIEHQRASREKNKKNLNLPFVNLVSTTNGTPYFLRIERLKFDHEIKGKKATFNNYGLSSVGDLVALPAW